MKNNSGKISLDLISLITGFFAFLLGILGIILFPFIAIILFVIFMLLPISNIKPAKAFNEKDSNIKKRNTSYKPKNYNKNANGEKDINYEFLSNAEKEEVDSGRQNPWDFEEDELGDDDYYSEDLDN